MSLTTMTSRSCFSGFNGASFGPAKTPLPKDGDLGCDSPGSRDEDGRCDGASTSIEWSGSAPALDLCFFFFFRFFGVEGAIPSEGARPSTWGISSISEILLVGLALDGDTLAFAVEDAG